MLTRQLPRYINERISNSYSINDKIEEQDTQRLDWIVVHYDGCPVNMIKKFMLKTQNKITSIKKWLKDNKKRMYMEGSDSDI